MKKFFPLLLSFLYTISFGQTYKSVPVTGFNHDVIADGTGKNAMSTTSVEMDAINISNNVISTRQFARTIGMNTGIPDNGIIVSQNKEFSLAGFGSQNQSKNNVLYLFKRQTGTLQLLHPQNFDGISLLALATEGPAVLKITLQFTSGNLLSVNHLLPDWFDGDKAFFAGFGRIKRQNGSKSGSIPFEAPGNNPRMYTIDIRLPHDQTLKSIGFINVSAGTNPESNRAFIFALSGYNSPSQVVVPPVVKEVKKEEVINPVVSIPVVTTPSTPKGFHVQGKILDSKSNGPVQAKYGLTENPIHGVTGKTGDYGIDLPAVGEYTMKVEAAGYIGILQKIKVINDPAGNVFNFSLQPVEIGTKVNLKSVLFKISTAILLEESYPELDMVADMLKVNPNMTIELAGHTDNRGTKSLNLKLSSERVNVVKDYLINKGIIADRIAGKGYGGSRPISKGSTEADHQLNRRVEFVVTKL